MPLQDRSRLRIGFLQIDAPILQLIERYPDVAHRASHIGSRRDHAEVAVQILQLRLAMALRAGFIEHLEILRTFRSVSSSGKELTTIDRLACPPVKPTDL